MQTLIANSLINYELFGEKNKESIIILHGWLRNLIEWRPIAIKLSNKYKVYILDLPGFGNSPLPEQDNIEMEWYGQIVEKFIKSENIKNPIGIGHSFGGRTLLVTASKIKFKKIFLVDTPGVTDRDTLTNIKIIIGKIVKYFLFPFPKYIVEKIRLKFSPSYKNLSKPLIEILKKIVKQNLTEYAEKIDCESILIWGENDKDVPLPDAFKLKNLIKNSTLRVIWGAGHSPHIEKTNKFINTINEYL